MALPRIDAFGPPAYGPLHGTEGVVFHTPENASHRLADALAIARWQATAANTSGGSYHGILGWDSDRGPMTDPDAWVLVRTVPFTQIAGSISTRRDAIWAPGRYPWLQQLLSAAAYADPNAYLHALSLSGKAAWWSTQLSTADGRAQVAGAITALARWVLRLEREFGYDAVLSLHRHWQTNRSDPDGLRFTDLVLDAYDKLTVPPAPQVTVAQLQAQLAATQELVADKDSTIRRLQRRLGDKDTRLDEAIAAATAARKA